MNPIDDMFRDGLGGRKGEVPADMWRRVSAGKPPVVPEGDGVDQYFSDALKDRSGDVPADMWSRIAATGVPAAATLDQVFADGLRDRSGEVPAGMWNRIWRARTAAPYAKTGRLLGAAAAILLLIGFGWWMLVGAGGEEIASAENPEVIALEQTTKAEDVNNAGSAAGAITVEGAGVRQAAQTLTENRVFATGNTTEPHFREAAITTANSASNTSATPTVAEEQQNTSEDIRKANDHAVEADSKSITEQPSVATETTIRDATRPDRPAVSALAELSGNRAIPALAIKSTDFNVKRRYQPKTPQKNSFRAANRHRLQTEFLFGAFYANQQFSAETDDQRAQRQIREVRENPGLSYQVSLRGAYRLNERLELRSGLTYSEIRNKFDYEGVVNGQSLLLKTNNHIRQLEAPLMLGFRIPGRRLNVSLNAGPLFNITTSVRGSFLHPDAAEPLSLAAAGQYRSNVGVGFMTSLSTTYVIGKKQPFVLLVEPFFKAYPGSYTSKDAPLRETYWAAGLQLGVRKGF